MLQELEVLHHDRLGAADASGHRGNRRLLLAGEVCVCNIHDSLGLPQPKVSRHLAYLRRAGLVAARKDGLWVHYRLARLEDEGIMSFLFGLVRDASGRWRIASEITTPIPPPEYAPAITAERRPRS